MRLKVYSLSHRRSQVFDLPTELGLIGHLNQLSRPAAPVRPVCAIQIAIQKEIPRDQRLFDNGSSRVVLSVKTDLAGEGQKTLYAALLQFCGEGLFLAAFCSENEPLSELNRIRRECRWKGFKLECKAHLNPWLAGHCQRNGRGCRTATAHKIRKFLPD